MQQRRGEDVECAGGEMSNTLLGRHVCGAELQFLLTPHVKGIYSIRGGVNQILLGMRHAFFYGIWWRQFECVIGLNNSLWGLACEQADVLFFEGKSMPAYQPENVEKLGCCIKDLNPFP